MKEGEETKKQRVLEPPPSLVMREREIFVRAKLMGIIVGWDAVINFKSVREGFRHAVCDNYMSRVRPPCRHRAESYPFPEHSSSFEPYQDPSRKQTIPCHSEDHNI